MSQVLSESLDTGDDPIFSRSISESVIIGIVHINTIILITLDEGGELGTNSGGVIACGIIDGSEGLNKEFLIGGLEGGLDTGLDGGICGTVSGRSSQNVDGGLEDLSSTSDTSIGQVRLVNEDIVEVGRVFLGDT